MSGLKLMKSKCDSLVCAVQNEAFSKQDKNRHLVQSSTIAMMCMYMVTVNLGADIWDKVTVLTSTTYTNILKIGSGIALVAFAIAALTWLFSKQQRRIDEAYDWMWRIVKGYVLLAGATFIFAYIANLFSDAPSLTNIALPGSGGGVGTL